MVERIIIIKKILEYPMSLKILLVVGNPHLPNYVLPYGVEIMAEALKESLNAQVKIVDPFIPKPFTPDIDIAISTFKPDIIGIGMRNLDSWFKPTPTETGVTGKNFLEDVEQLVCRLKNYGIQSSRIILGGTGFSIAPFEILRKLNLPYGIVGPGERAFPQFLKSLMKGDPVERLPGVAHVNGSTMNTSYVPVNGTNININYVPKDTLHRKIARLRGDFIPLRTRSGCGFNCMYCCEGVFQAKPPKLRDLGSIEEELSQIKSLGITRIFVADGEFNSVSTEHFEEVVRLFKAYQIKWMAYCLPLFTDKSIKLISESGCIGIILTIDSASPTILKRISRPFTLEEIENSLEKLLMAGIPTQSTLLFGLPGETCDTIKKTIRFVKHYKQVIFKYLCGVRVYPNTKLHRWVCDSNTMNVYGKFESDFLDIALYSEPFSPWELTSYVKNLLHNVPNAYPEFN